MSSRHKRDKNAGGDSTGKTKEQSATIPNYTKDDFLKTDKPFVFLDSFRGNPFMMQQMFMQLRDYAQTLGIKSIKQLWETYKASAAGETSVIDVTETNFDSFPLPRQLVCGKYNCDDRGITVVDGYFERVVCPHPIAPIRRFKNVDTREELLEIWFRRGSAEGGFKDETITIPKDTIANGILSLAKYGIVVTPKSAKDLSAYLLDVEQYNYDWIEERKSVKRLGWIGDGCHTFSPYVDDVYFDGEEDFGGVFATVRSCGEYEKWIDIVRKVRAEKTPARIYLAAAFASVILKPCGLLPFMVHAFGGSESGKTSALMLAASVWANPEPGEYVGTYNGTRYAQETTAGFLNSLPMCIDELQIQTSQGAKDFDDIIYQLCEGVSKKQGTASGGLRRQQKWRNTILSNGEHTILKPQSGGGARNRVIEIESPAKMYSDLVGLCEIINHNYGFAGRQFVEWILVPENMDRMKQLQKDYYHELQQMDVTDKQAGSASALLTADHIATEIIFKDKHALTASDLRDVLLTRAELDVNQQTLEWLQEFIAINSMHFYVSDQTQNEEDAKKDFQKTELWGMTDNDAGYVYVIRAVFNKIMKDHGHDARSFLAWAKRKEILLFSDGHLDILKRIPVTNRPIRCVCIRFENETGYNPESVDTSGIEGPQDLPF